MKHKLIFGGIGLLVTAAAVAIPLGIILSDSHDDLTLEQQAAQAAKAAEEAARVSAEAAKAVADKANEDLLNAQNKANDNQLITNLNSAIVAFRQGKTLEELSALDNYINAQNNFILATESDKATAKTEVDAKFNLLADTQHANAIKDAFDAIFNDPEAKAIYVTLATAQNNAIEKQIELQNAEAAQKAAEEAAKSIQEQLAVYTLKEKQLKYWNEHINQIPTGAPDPTRVINFQGYTPGTWSLANGDTPVPKKFPIDFAIPEGIKEIPADTFTINSGGSFDKSRSAHLPTGLEFPTSLEKLSPFAFAGVENVPLGLEETNVTIIPAHAFEGTTLPEGFTLWRSGIVEPVSEIHDYAFKNAIFTGGGFGTNFTPSEIMRDEDGNRNGPYNHSFEGATFPRGITLGGYTLNTALYGGWKPTAGMNHSGYLPDTQSIIDGYPTA